MKVEVAPTFSDSLPERPALTSLFRYSPGLVLVAVALADMARVADPDIWWHMRVGLDALRAGHPVWNEPYSYTALEHPWLNHEWLTEAIMGASYRVAGVLGLKLMKLACAATVVCFVAAAEGETGAPILLQLGILLATAVCIAPQIQFRPQSFSFAILSVLIYLLARETHGRRGPLWLAVPMLALWANLHGAFILGLMALAVFTGVVAVQEIAAGRGMRRAYRLAAITICAMLATLVTPYGIGTWTVIGHALANPYTRTIIVDWQPLTTQLAAQWQVDKASVVYLMLGIVLMGATAVSVVIARSAADAAMVAVATIMSVAAFASVRNFPAAVIACAVPLARHLPLAMRRIAPRIEVDRGGPREAASRLNQVALVAIALVLFVETGLFSKRIEAKDPYPVSACNFMQANRLEGNILIHFTWGGYQIWRLPAKSKVFMDGRYDTVFPRGVIDDYLRFNFNQPDGDRVLTAYPTEYVLIPPDSGGRKIMEGRADWRVIYRDEVSVLYARVDSAAAHIEGVPATGVAAPAVFP